MRELIFIHGRSQQMKDAAALKKSWVNAMHQGMTNAQLTLEIKDSDIRFPYYGDTLYALVEGSETVPDVVVKGSGASSAGESQFIEEVILEAVESHNILDEEIAQRLPAADALVVKKGFLNWGWTLAALRTLNDLGCGTAALEAFTTDVYRYLTDPGTRKEIDDGVRTAFGAKEAVVVSHSLGTIVAYSLLTSDGEPHGWNIPTLITLGSPLAVSPIARALRPIDTPSCVSAWFNGRDPKDVVALFPLTPPHFPDLGIKSKDDIVNTSDNHHGIESYLSDPDVAQWIYSALTEKVAEASVR